MIERVKDTLIANDGNVRKSLHQFAGSGDVDALKSLLESHMVLDINVSSKGKNTALHVALIQNQQGLVIDYLIERGADINAFNSKGFNTIALSIIHCRPGTHALRKLIEAGAIWSKPYQRGKFSGLKTLDIARECKNIEALQYLQSLKSEPNVDEEKIDPIAIYKLTRPSKGNHNFCSLCNCRVKFPSKLSFIRQDQERAEIKADERQKNEPCGKEKSERSQSAVKEIYTSRWYLDQFMSHSNGKCFEDLCQIEFHGINNKNKLRKEISESYSILHAAQQCCIDDTLIDQAPDVGNDLNLTNVFLIDLCSGKSLTTTLASVLFPSSSSNGKGNQFLAVDKLPVHLIPHMQQENTSYWSRNIMTDIFIRELEREVKRHSEKGLTPILVGMHLCGNLSERAIDIFHEITLIKGLILSPCCLPKVRGQKHTFNRVIREGQDPYKAWVFHLKELIESKHASDNALSIRCYDDDHIHSIKNAILSAVRII
mmetsp:Transcript_23525/g.35745  ORF Transcript_23525/g.35745 Transcript_23525/m.35745 type:complete len:485 (+) Transcript_23525:3-1457(+)